MSPYYNDECQLFEVDGVVQSITEQIAEQLSANHEVVAVLDVPPLIAETEEEMHREIAHMTDEQIDFESKQECTCTPDLPDGRSFPICLPCKVRMDLAEVERIRRSVLDLDLNDDDIPFS